MTLNNKAAAWKIIAINFEQVPVKNDRTDGAAAPTCHPLRLPLAKLSLLELSTQEVSSQIVSRYKKWEVIA